MKYLILFLLSACNFKSSFNFSNDYRSYPIAVDCEKASDVDLTFQKTGMPTLKVSINNITFKTISDFSGNPRNVCIFDELTLLDFCKYKGKDEVAPYWVADYSKINSVKCSEILK